MVKQEICSFHQSVNKVCKPTEVAERKTNPDKWSFMSFFFKVGRSKVGKSKLEKENKRKNRENASSENTDKCLISFLGRVIWWVLNSFRQLGRWGSLTVTEQRKGNWKTSKIKRPSLTQPALVRSKSTDFLDFTVEPQKMFIRNPQHAP